MARFFGEINARLRWNFHKKMHLNVGEHGICMSGVERSNRLRRSQRKCCYSKAFQIIDALRKL